MGEFADAQIQEGLQSGYFLPTDWFWTEGMTEWQALSTLVQPLRESQSAVQALPAPSGTLSINPYAAPPSSLARPPQKNSRAFVQKATAGSRLAAYILDNVALFACFLPSGFAEDSHTAGDDVMVFVSIGLFAILCIFNLVLIATQGQTIGKKLMGIRIAEVNDSAKAGFFRIVFLRALIGRGLLALIPLYGLIDILYIFNEDGRCLHDKVGGTHVIKVSD